MPCSAARVTRSAGWLAPYRMEYPEATCRWTKGSLTGLLCLLVSSQARSPPARGDTAPGGPVTRAEDHPRPRFGLHGRLHRRPRRLRSRTPQAVRHHGEERTDVAHQV